MPPSPATAFLNHPDQSNLPSRPIATNPNEIADFFNTYFASVFTSENLPVQHPNRTDPVLTELKVTELEVETLLNSLDTNKATGSDEIPARLLKETASIITPSICKLFNKSLQQGTVPQDWKLANVVPVYKKGDKEYTENYRPISLLPIISKVLERYIFMNIRQHFSGIIYDHQHGFLQGKSCVTNLLEALDYIGACLDKGGQVDMVYLDMSKAFDRINHKRLTSKLANSGIGGNLLKWFQSYLTDRRQRVTVLGVTSKSLPVCSGVPQGSILGPALFLLYVNDLLEAPTSSRAAMFADDTKIFSAIQSKIDVTSLQTDLGTLEHWSTVSGLSFNQSKCKRQTLTRKKAPVASSYKLDNSIISITQGAIIRVPTYRRYAKFMVWYFFVFSQVPRRYAEIYYSRTYIFLLAITSKPGKVFKTVKNFSCTCKFHASDIFWDVIFALEQKMYRHRPTEKKSLG